MELRHLRYFVAVAEAENVTHAAEKLHVSQPALSRQISDLEDEMNVLLLDRGAKSVRLTEAGRVFLQEARMVLERADEAVKKARSAASGASGEIRVAYAPSLTVEILPRALRNFQAEFPGVRVLLEDLSTEEMFTGLREEKLHVALTVNHGGATLRGLHFDELAQYPICVAMPPNHPLANSRAIAWKKLAGENLVGYSKAGYPEYHEELEELFKMVGSKMKIVEEQDGVTSLMAAVESGRGIAFVPSCMACMAGPRLKVIPLTPPSQPIVVGAFRREGEKSAAVQKFIAAAKSGSDARPARK
ncbi:MAG TPA: LysR substrate-binding domain-containing protein [Chthoniobacteraceae bacterium]|nr:LysR substrate-binding domain-containing protein [Chthoniobacteraceae bacterium]